MTLETLNTYGQLIANIAVVVTLIFVAVQLRLSVKMMRHQAMTNHAEKFQSISRMMVEADGVAELWVKGRAGMHDLTDGERARYVNLYCYMLRAIEELHLQHRAGLVDQTFWDSSIQILRDAHPLAGPQEVWALRRHIFTPAFQAFVEDYVRPDAARPLYHAPGAAKA
jgi:hypothetical protein